MSDAGVADAGQVDKIVNATAGKTVDPPVVKDTGDKSPGKAAGGKNGSATAADTGVDRTGAGEAPTWPEDWREKIAGDDEKELARLRRYASLDNYLKRTKDIETRVRAGQLRPVLPENARPEEVADYRKAHGIPAEPTVEAYGLKFPEGYEPNDADKADVGEFLADMHKINAPPAFVQAAWGRYLATQAKVQQQLHDAAQATTVERKAEIRAEYGRDYERNMRVGNAFLAEHLGEEKAGSLAATVLADGTRLGDHPDFVRLFVAAALANADDKALVTSELGDGSSIANAYEAALELKFTDPKTYNSPEHQKKLMRLAAAKAQKAA